MSNDVHKDSEYYAGFDYLRALLSLAVIAIHTQLLSAHGYFMFDERAGINIFDVVQFNVFFLAVPVFFIISLFLFYKKRATPLKDGRKVYQFFILYLFWTSAWILFKDTRPGNGLDEAILFILKGGKSIFWFFLSLVFVTALAAFTRKLSRRLTWIALCASTFAIALFPILNIYNPAFKYLVAFWNPLLFIPYVFAARLFVYYEGILKSRKWIPLMLLIVFVVLCSVEWTTLVHPNHKLVQYVEIPIYSRVSVVIGSCLFFIASLKIHNTPPKLIKLLSSSSLGLYCIHPFLIELTLSVRNKATGVDSIQYFVLITMTSLVLTYFVKQVLRARLI